MNPSSRTSAIFFRVLLAVVISLGGGLWGESCRAADAEVPVRVMSFNIRYGTASDGINHWDNRKEALVRTIQEFGPDLLGTQETLDFQKDFLATQFPHLEPFGVGRDDGGQRGEMAALFFDKVRFEKLEGGHFWLSPTPDSIGSKGWDAALPRIATWVKLHDKTNTQAKPILFLNTHFDHKGKEARIESARLIRRQLAELSKGCRVVVTGDFNADEDSEPYKALFEEASAPAANALSLRDTYRETESPLPDDAKGTFSNFLAENTKGARIDWIGCSAEWQVRWARIDRTSAEGRTPSDHFPVVAVLRSKDSVPTFRTLTYNIHHGRGMDEKIDLVRIAKIVRDSDADWVALQEVDNKTKRSMGVDQAAELAKLTGMYHCFGKAIDFQGGEYGQAILSRYPIADSRVIALENIDGREQRVALISRFTMRNLRVTAISTHLDHAHAELRAKQSDQLKRLETDGSDFAVLAGDMNDGPDSLAVTTIRQSWSGTEGHPAVATFPADAPKQQIDYVFARPEKRLRALRVQRIESTASDHAPLLVEWEIVEQAK
jgi:endonuclease/exonuclease/phosphatase family metal-dependent hydrolase